MTAVRRNSRGRDSAQCDARSLREARAAAGLCLQQLAERSALDLERVRDAESTDSPAQLDFDEWVRLALVLERQHMGRAPGLQGQRRVGRHQGCDGAGRTKVRSRRQERGFDVASGPQAHENNGAGAPRSRRYLQEASPFGIMFPWMPTRWPTLAATSGSC
jgi:hypothetical protein